MDAKKFLETYARAWETRDPDLAALLFTENATYHENPFNEPIAGREGIRAYWRTATDPQRDIHVTVGETLVTGNTLIADWKTQYTHAPSGEKRETRGILVAEFEGELVKRFREYWHRVVR